MADQTVIWTPQPGPQTDLVTCPVFEVLFGGARGGGKTEGSLGDWLQHSGLYGELAAGLFIRRKLTQLVDVMERAKKLYKPLGAQWHEQKKLFTMPNGALLRFAYLERDADADEYQGHNYTRVYIEEVTNFPSPAPINKLRATLRSAQGVPTGLRMTGNPGGPGHHWVKRRFIDPAPMGYHVISETEEVPDEFGNPRKVVIDRVFIPSKLGDNPLLVRNDPTYVLRLRQTGSEKLVRAWLEGNWDLVDGAYFDEFEPDKHVLPADFARLLPKHLMRFRAMDWGSAKPFSVGWYAVSDGTFGLPRGALIKYDEWYGTKDGANTGLKMNAASVALGVLAREKAAGHGVSYGVADPSIFIQNGGKSIAELMAEVGCFWQAGDNRRIPGWEELRRRLQGTFTLSEGETPTFGEPMIYFLANCEHTIRTIPALQHDENKPEDVDTEGEDHAPDETRYACMSWPWVQGETRAAGITYPKAPHEMTINEHLERQWARQRAAEVRY